MLTAIFSYPVLSYTNYYTDLYLVRKDGLSRSKFICSIIHILNKIVGQIACPANVSVI